MLLSAVEIEYCWLRYSELLKDLGAREQYAQNDVLERLFWLLYRMLAMWVTPIASMFLIQWYQSDQENQKALQGKVEVLHLEYGDYSHILRWISLSLGHSLFGSHMHIDAFLLKSVCSVFLPFLLHLPSQVSFFLSSVLHFVLFRDKNLVVLIELEPEPMKA